MAESIGPRITIAGEAEFNASIRRIDQSLRTVGSEMQAVTSQFDKNDRSQEALTAQSGVLTRAIDKHREKLTLLQGQYDKQKSKLNELAVQLKKATTEYGENSDEAIKAEKAYKNQETTLSKLEQSLNVTTTGINKMERELSDNSKTIKDIERGYNDAGDEIDEFGQAVKKSSDGSLQFSDVLKANLLSQAIIEGVKRLARAAKDMAKDFIESAAAVKAENSQFEQTFGDMGDAAEAAVRRVATASGILDTRLNSTASQIYAFARASGAESPEALSLMETALQAAADGAAYYDRSLKDTSESLMSFLKGNYANDAALGVSATETTRNAKATELFGKKYNDLSEIQKQQTLLKMVTDAQELSGAMGQAAREADGWENVQGNLNETWRQFQAFVGAPILENLIPIIQNITAEFQNWTKSVDWDAFADKITGLFDFVMNNGQTIIGVIAGIAAAFVGWQVGQLIQGIITSFKALTTATQAADVANKGLNTTMAANPIGLVISIIGILVTSLVTLWNTNEGFREAVISAWNAIKEAAQVVWGAIVTFFTETIPAAWNTLVGFFQGIPEVINSVIQWFAKLPYNIGLALGTLLGSIVKFGIDTWNWVITEIPKIIQGIIGWFQQLPGRIWSFLVDIVSKIGQWGSNMVSTAQTEIPKFIDRVISFIRDLPGNIWDFLKDIISKVKDWASSLISTAATEIPLFVNKVVDLISSLPGKMLDIGKNIVHGIWEGISGAWDWLWGKITGFAGGIVDGFKSALGIHSPSKIFADMVGKNMALGIGVGFEDNISRVTSDMAQIVKAGIPHVATPSPAYASAAAGVQGMVTPVINYYATYNSPAAPTPAEVNRQNRYNAQRLALIARRA